MKRQIQLLLVMLLLYADIMQGACSTACNICDHTTFVPRTNAQNLVLELSMFDYYRFFSPQTCIPGVYAQVIAPYFFTSTEPNKIARYFLPGAQESILVGQNNTSDVSSAWLEIISPTSAPFSAEFSISPRRTVIGGALGLYCDIGSWFGGADCWYNNLWGSIFIPVQQVRHALHPSEVSLSGPGLAPGFPSVIAALNNPAWNYGKFCTGVQKKTGVDDISLRLGIHAYQDQNNYVDFYGQLFIPTGKGTQSHCVFEPLVGSRHVGLGAGIDGQWYLDTCDAITISFLYDARYAYFLKRHEIRSIDLFNGDWSRYLLVASPTSTNTPLPGINYFTQSVSVTPRSMFELWTAVGFDGCDWHAEIGYDFWFRDREHLALPDLDLGVGIFDIGANPTVRCNASSSCARICQSIANQPDAPASDATFVTVKNSKAINSQGYTSHGGANYNYSCHCASPNQCSYLNLKSAAAPLVMSSTVFATISRQFCWCERSGMIGIGSSYEIAHRAGALNQFGIWLKTAFTF